MPTMEITVAQLEPGYDTKMTPHVLRNAVAHQTHREKFKSKDGKWERA